MKKFVNAFFAFCLALVMCTLVLSSCKNKNQAPENVETKELRCETSYCNLDIDSIYQNALYATPFNNISLRELPKEYADYRIESFYDTDTGKAVKKYIRGKNSNNILIGIEYNSNENMSKFYTWESFDGSSDISQLIYSFEYDSNGRLHKVVSSIGDFRGRYSVYGSYKLEYDSNNQLIKSVDYDEDGNATGDYTVFEYNANGKIEKISNYVSPQDDNDDNDDLFRSVTYTYDDSGRITKEYIYSVHLEYFNEPLSGYETHIYKYNKDGVLEEALVYDYKDVLEQKQNYNEYGAIISEITCLNEYNIYTEYEYGEHGLIRETSYKEENGIKEKNDETIIVYDANGNRIKYMSANGVTMREHKFDSKNNCIKTAFYLKDGSVFWETDCYTEPETFGGSIYLYDSVGNVVGIKNSSPGSETIYYYEYNESGQIVKEFFGERLAAEYEYYPNTMLKKSTEYLIIGVKETIKEYNEDHSKMKETFILNSGESSITEYDYKLSTTKTTKTSGWAEFFKEKEYTRDYFDPKGNKAFTILDKTGGPSPSICVYNANGEVVFEESQAKSISILFNGKDNGELVNIMIYKNKQENYTKTISYNNGIVEVN